MEFREIMRAIKNQPGVNKIQDTTKAVLIGYIKDDFQNKKEVFTPATEAQKAEFDKEQEASQM